LTPEGYEDYLRAGINDWGGISPVTLDYINPEAPWPELELLARKTAERGFVLRPRLPIYPEFLSRGEPWVSSSLLQYIERLCGRDYLVKGDLHEPLGIAL
jgi:FO synthase